MNQTDDVLDAVIDSAQALGRHEGMLRAVAICEAKSRLHAQYLPPNFRHKDGDHDQAATCGRRDEAEALAYEIRKDFVGREDVQLGEQVKVAA